MTLPMGSDMVAHWADLEAGFHEAVYRFSMAADVEINKTFSYDRGGELTEHRHMFDTQRRMTTLRRALRCDLDFIITIDDGQVEFHYEREKFCPEYTTKMLRRSTVVLHRGTCTVMCGH